MTTFQPEHKQEPLCTIDPYNITLENIPIFFARVTDSAKLPSKSNVKSCYWDITNINMMCIMPNANVVLQTGLRMNIPQGYCGHMIMRHNLRTKQDLQVLPNSISPGNTKKVQIIICNNSTKSYIIAKQSKIVQLVVHKVADDSPLPVPVRPVKSKRKVTFASSTTVYHYII